MTDPSSKYGWRPGYTVGTSEGRWSPVNDDKRMRYEKANPQHYETPATEAYRSGWERIFGPKTCPHCARRIQRGQTVTVDGTAHSGCEARDD